MDCGGALMANDSTRVTISANLKNYSNVDPSAVEKKIENIQIMLYIHPLRVHTRIDQMLPAKKKRIDQMYMHGFAVSVNSCC